MNNDTQKQTRDEDGLAAQTCYVVFLDFDGVIRVPIYEGGWLAPDNADFCQNRMEMLSKVAKAVGAKIVVSSDWRNMENLEEISGYLSPHLNDLLHEDWATPIMGHRWNEVQAWLINHPEVSNYAILEDFPQHFEGCPQGMKDRIFICSKRYGLVPQINAKLLNHFTHND